ncbi:MAG: hypothetical protein JO255_16555 [Alphaproteobacteria bacterium]|nr:hypothetical protein [Alphaproteobacteria bacterium]
MMRTECGTGLPPKRGGFSSDFSKPTAAMTFGHFGETPAWLIQINA